MPIIQFSHVLHADFRQVKNFTKIELNDIDRSHPTDSLRKDSLTSQHTFDIKPRYQSTVSTQLLDVWAGRRQQYHFSTGGQISQTKKFSSEEVFFYCTWGAFASCSHGQTNRLTREITFTTHTHLTSWAKTLICASI